MSSRMPQRGIGLQPKVGAPAPTFGERGNPGTTSTRLWRNHAVKTEMEWPQPRCGWGCLRTVTQGSSCLATLGFGTESRWDSRLARGPSTDNQESQEAVVSLAADGLDGRR